MRETIEEFKKIGSHEDLGAFVKKYKLVEIKSEGVQIIGTYTGQIENSIVTVTHRWYDRCKPFLIQEDGNEIKLELHDFVLDETLETKVKYEQD